MPDAIMLAVLAPYTNVRDWVRALWTLVRGARKLSAPTPTITLRSRLSCPSTDCCPTARHKAVTLHALKNRSVATLSGFLYLRHAEWYDQYINMLGRKSRFNLLLASATNAPGELATLVQRWQVPQHPTHAAQRSRALSNPSCTPAPLS